MEHKLNYEAKLLIIRDAHSHSLRFLRLAAGAEEVLGVAELQDKGV